jgi:putative membrane protein
MKSVIAVSIFLASVTFAQTGSTQPGKGGTPMHGTTQMSDQAFLTKAIQGNLAEIKLGELAQQNASNQAVKQFGERMVTDHTNLNEQAKSLAAQKGMTPPSSPNAKQDATYNSMQSKTGAAFDKAYMTDMLKDHRMDISEFEKEATNGNDPDVKALAQKALPILQEHLRLAETTAKQVGVSTGSTTGGMR